ncbi:hypothetical protein QJS10_CPA07g00978 [Acorus calamus]|uniref:Hyaluronan/mRNA-binding protein domain-containing protein n=1 Tax=Acorus calamus TaxID=4465 RepID=A0AAV9EFG9_ACOCL|nr:hypothetical protein QJS10_CPA07g00978 [Acorus calamus]
MATMNPFDLLGGDDNEDLTVLIQKVDTKKVPAAAPVSAHPAKLPSRPAPPAQAVREARSEAGSAPRGGGRGGYARGRGGRGSGPNRDFGNGNDNGYAGGYNSASGGGGGEEGEQNKPSERSRGTFGAPRQPFRGPRRGGYAGNGGDAGAGDEEQRPPRRPYERRSGTGRGYEVKREGSGRGNWGSATDEALAQETEALNVEEKIASPEKQTEQEDVLAADANKENKENPANEVEEKEPEEKEMTLDEYEKIREEKRKALLALKSEERKVDVKEFESMQQIKKENVDVFIKLGSDKDLLKRRESADRDEKVKKSVSITEFLKPAEGERHYGSGGRGRGRGRGERGPYRGGYGGGSGGFGGANTPATPTPKIEDIGQFPSLGGK